MNMATILQQPDQYSFAGNIKTIIVTSALKIVFRLMKNGDTLFESTYSPDLNGRIEIDIRKSVQDSMSSQLPSEGDITTKAFDAFSFSIDSGADELFYAFSGGVDANITASWFTQNFLTWQPQVIYTSWVQAQYLSYIALQAGVAKVKGYFSDGTDETISLGVITSGMMNILNVQYSSIAAKLTKQPQYIDVWIENGSNLRLSYIQRVVLRNTTPNDDFFIFQNTLGGWDSICFDGLLKNESASDVKTFTQEEYTSEYQVDISEKYSKNTGFFKSESHRIWAQEFFKTTERYFLSHRDIYEKIAVSASTINAQRKTPSSYSFTFSLSKSTKFLNLPRTETPDIPLEIIDPAGTLFFLAPRLDEFTTASTDDDALLFPVQTPFVQSWKKITWGTIWNFLYDKILASAIGLATHVHDNFSVLGKLSESDGKLNYDGKEIVSTNVGVTLGSTSDKAFRGDYGFELYNAKPKGASALTSGLYILTDIPVTDDNSVLLTIAGTGLGGLNTFNMLCQARGSTNGLIANHLKAIAMGEKLSVYIFTKTVESIGYIAYWIKPLTVSASYLVFSTLKVTANDAQKNRIKTIQDIALPTEGVSNQYIYRNITDAVLDLGNISNSSLGTLINAATAKTVIVDADMFALMDSEANNVIKKFSWASFKARLKVYFDTVYSLANHSHSGYALSDHTHSGYAASTHTHSAATNSADGFMTSTDKAKLDGATAVATADTVMKRDANGKTSVSAIIINGIELTIE